MFVCHTLIHFSQNIKQMEAVPISNGIDQHLLNNKKNNMRKSMVVICCYQTFQPWPALDDDVYEIFVIFSCILSHGLISLWSIIESLLCLTVSTQNGQDAKLRDPNFSNFL